MGWIGLMGMSRVSLVATLPSLSRFVSNLPCKCLVGLEKKRLQEWTNLLLLEAPRTSHSHTTHA